MHFGLDLNLSNQKTVAIFIGACVLVLLFIVCLVRTFCPCLPCLIKCGCKILVSPCKLVNHCCCKSKKKNPLLDSTHV
jgi:hypothetical protein